MTDDALIRRIVEAALFAASHPLSLPQLVALFPDDAPAPPDSIERALAALAEESATRGVELVEVASGFRFQIRADVQPWVARLWAERQTRYSRALLETLALIAYRQPITRGEIEQIRGVAVSTSIIKTLEERDWVRVVGHRDVPGKPALYGTTRGFLDYFGLKSLDQLPPLTELHEIPELEPQLQLEPVQAASGADSVIGAAPSEPIHLATVIGDDATDGDEGDDIDHDEIDDDDDLLANHEGDQVDPQHDASAEVSHEDSASSSLPGDEREAGQDLAEQDTTPETTAGQAGNAAPPEVADDVAGDDDSSDDDAAKAPSERTYE